MHNQSYIFSGDGAIYIDKTRSIKAQNPKGQVVNTVGSGDSTVAGMVAGLESGLSLEDAFQQAVASGTTAFTEDLATIEDIEKIKSQVTITVLDGSEINENHRITNKKIQLLWIYQRLIKWCH